VKTSQIGRSCRADRKPSFAITAVVREKASRPSSSSIARIVSQTSVSRWMTRTRARHFLCHEPCLDLRLTGDLSSLGSGRSTSEADCSSSRSLRRTAPLAPARATLRASQSTTMMASAMMNSMVAASHRVLSNIDAPAAGIAGNHAGELSESGKDKASPPHRGHNCASAFWARAASGAYPGCKRVSAMADTPAPRRRMTR
jgi:hypothetical protein